MLLGSTFRERAVNVDVIFAVINAMIMIPMRIHMTEKTRAATDFGALSPYLVQQEKKNHFYKFILLEYAAVSHGIASLAWLIIS